MAQLPTVNVSITGRMYPLPGDMEEQDKKHIQEYINSYMDASYPSFEPEIVRFMDDAYRGNVKECFLPALKALDYDGDFFYSPMKDGKWENLELVAKCQNVRWNEAAYKKAYWGTFGDDTDKEDESIDHSPPHDGCVCGVYGSVNIDEMAEWVQYTIRQALVYDWGITPPRAYTTTPEFKKPKKRAICLIEPSPDADVILCRKGWKASKAFISEIIYSEYPYLEPTMSVEQASNLLSIAWKRNIDVQGVFDENR